MESRFKLYDIAITDLKLMARDRSLTIFLIIPFLILAVLRWGIPFVISFYPEIENYLALITGVMAVVVAVFPGFILAFIIIDEKEQQVLSVYRVMPVAFKKIIYYRVLLISIIGFMYSFVILRFSEMVVFAPGQLLQTAILSSFLGPISAFLILSVADNKIEGMTYMKGINFIWIIPAAQFFIDSSWSNVFAVIPDYWTLQIINSQRGSFFIFLSGLLHHMVVLIIAIRLFIHKEK